MKLFHFFKLKTVVTKLLILFTLVCFNQASAQIDKFSEFKELNIQTKFKAYGSLLETVKENSKSISQFSKGQKCIVLSYHGHDIYKVQYKKWMGFVISEYLVVNEEMNNAVKAYKANQNNRIQDPIDVVVQNQAKAEELTLLEEVDFDKVSAQINEFSEFKELNIQTKFSRYGSMFENPNPNSPIKTEFNKGQKCQVIAYYGKGNYKIKYKRFIGFVTSEFLKINDEMRDVIERYNKAIYLKMKSDSIEIENKKEINAQEKFKEEKQKELNSNVIEKEEKLKTDRIQTVKDSINILKYRTSCHYQLNEIDNVSNKTILRTDKYEVHNKISMELYKDGNKKYVFINYSDNNLGCVSYFSNNRSFAKIRLENNEIITIYHTWNMDCVYFSLRGILTNSAISKLENYPIKSIILQGTKEFIVIENIEYKEFFIDKLKCITE